MVSWVGRSVPSFQKDLGMLEMRKTISAIHGSRRCTSFCRKVRYRHELNERISIQKVLFYDLFRKTEQAAISSGENVWIYEIGDKLDAIFSTDSGWNQEQLLPAR